MEKTENREVVVKYCDFCGNETKHLSTCAVCKKEMCNDGGGKTHTAYSVEIYRYRDAQRLHASICKECGDSTVPLTIQAFIDGMMGQLPVLPVK